MIVATPIDIISKFAYNQNVKNMKDFEIYSVRQAARQMGISQQHLRLLLKKKVVPGTKLGGMWLVHSLHYDRRRKPKGG